MNNINASSISQEEFHKQSSSSTPNAYLVKSSRFLKKEDRDSRLFLSPRHEDFLILKKDQDLVEQLGKEYVLKEVFDELALESKKVRELTNLIIWKQDELRKKTKELLDICARSNCSIEDAKYATTPEVSSLFCRCEALKTDIQEIEEQIKHIRQVGAEEPLSAIKPPSKRLITLSHAELIQKSIPPREFLLTPWLPEAGVAMVFSQPGIGKTNFGLSIAYTVASGGEMLWWKAPKARPVLYFDAEMHESDLQSRIKKLEAGFNKKLSDPRYLRYFNGSWQPQGVSIPDLATAQGQNLIGEQIEDAAFIVIDNLSTVCQTGNENEAGAWVKIQHWLLSLRWKGITTLLVHHAGKSTTEGGIPVQRGSSMREVILEANLALKRPKGYSPDQGCVFEGHFLKSRSFSGSDAEPFEARLEEKNGALVWTYRKLALRNYDHVIDLYNENITNAREIAEELGISRQAVQKHITRARKAGDIR